MWRDSWFQLHICFLGSGLTFCVFEVFGAQKMVNDCLVVWKSNLYLRAMQWFSGIKIGIYDQWFLILSQCFWDSWILMYCQFNSYFTFFYKGETLPSLACNFYCSLVKECWALKVAWRFSIQGLVASKLVACKESVFQICYSSHYHQMKS